MNRHWNTYELYFYHEFVNDENFPEEKRELLQQDLGFYFISQDFTIYQEKDHLSITISDTDFHRNLFGFTWMLRNLPIPQVKNLMQFHFDKYLFDKRDFLQFVYHELKGMKHHQGKIEVAPPEQKIVAMNWCQQKLENFEPNIHNEARKKSERTFINVGRIATLSKMSIPDLDVKKLIQMLSELNDNYAWGNFLSVAILGRAIIDHIPPVFKLNTFNEVANNYGTKSFQKNMQHLNVSMRSIADNYLHIPIRKNEVLPNENQIDFSRELDFLLAEVIRIHS